jgi:glycosyltransferase involved in cell wall biosynthesis
MSLKDGQREAGREGHRQAERPDGAGMKVLLDISTLGAAENPHQSGTRGIFRVVEHTARALLEAPDCQAYFYAVQNRAAAQRYFKKKLEMAAPGRACFADPALPSRWLIRMLTAAEDFLAKHYIDPPWRWLASGRILWKLVRVLLGSVEHDVAGGLNIFHRLGGDAPGWARRQPATLHRFVTVYDLIPDIHPEFYPVDTVRRGRRALKGLRSSDWILCISDATRRDLLRLYPQCDPAKTLVTYLAAEDIFRPERSAEKIASARRNCGIPGGAPYFLSVSVLEPRKNFATVIHGFADFAEAHPQDNTCLVLVGQSGWNTQAIADALSEQQAHLRPRLIFTGFVPDADLAALYSGALAFVYMSFYEGFGLPPLEAMQCGTPVIVSNTSSLPEVVGDAGILLSPEDRRGLAEAMRLLAHDDTRRERLAAAALDRARDFSWNRYRADVLAAYRRASRASEG